MKKPNLHLVFQWLIFLPVILPLCVIFGAIQGVVNTVEQMAQQMWTDVSTIDKVEASELWFFRKKEASDTLKHFFLEL